jgi:cytochrome c peroxidase
VWKKLDRYWSDPTLARSVGMIGLPGVAGAALAADKGGLVVKVKVPRGLDDPLGYIPAANPPTRGKWELGRRLFFDPSWLTATGKQSCSSCHQPDKNFTDGTRTVEGSYNVPTLINCVYNTHQFWDGRAVCLEEVVQQKLEDEREPKQPGPFRHVFPGVIGRLRASKSYTTHFERVFGVPANQDSVGKALATYLRTLLAGDSIHDRARHQQRHKGDRELRAAHYEAVLDEAALKALGRVKEARARVAAGLVRGWALFGGPAGCAACHKPDRGHFSDSRFHNIGVSLDDPARFARAPLGERNRYLKGAFKTPTLRGLPWTAPYFHNGVTDDLSAVVYFHVQPLRDAPHNPYLDPLLALPDGARRDFGLTNQDIADLVLLLKALDSEVDRSVRTSPD